MSFEATSGTQATRFSPGRISLGIAITTIVSPIEMYKLQIIDGQKLKGMATNSKEKNLDFLVVIFITERRG